MKYQNINIGVLAVAAAFLLGSCSEIVDGEQYKHYVSFKAPTTSSTVTQIRVKYKEEGTRYRLPLIVSGTTNNTSNLDVRVAVDSDTLYVYNMEQFGEERQDLWYRELGSSRYIFSPVTRIPAGENSSLIDIMLDFKGLDFSDNWLLPLIVEDHPSYGYQSNPRLNFNNALLWFTPFNDFSGTYQATALNVKVDGDPTRLPIQNRTTYVVDENSVFFYAGAIDEYRADRKLFKVKATFHVDHTFVPESGSEVREKGTVELTAMNNVVDLNFAVNGTPTYEVRERMDSETPTTKIRTMVISGMDYSFSDPKKVPDRLISYNVTGVMSLERRINTAIPDEEFAIMW